MKRINRLARSKPALARAGAAPPTPEERELVLTEIGARGDALAAGEAGPLYAPFGLAGERVRARVLGERADILEILTPSPERQAAPCASFGRCGGCQLQHWAEAPYLDWKREQVVRALERRGLGVDVAPTVAAWGQGRRRAAFHAGRVGGAVRLGFMERGGSRLLPIEACPALAPALAAALPGIEAAAALFLPQRGDITLACLATDAGVEVAVKGAGRADALDRGKLEAAARVAETFDLARLSLEADPVITRRTPRLAMGRALVEPPPGAFLQPTAEGEEALARLAMEALGESARVVDLFAGIGTFALRAAEKAEVLAVEAGEEMLAALTRAADGAGGALKRVSVLRRDLLRTPLSALEMKKFDGAVIDPPRSGARLQAEQIARAPIRRLACVSCDPATFARDVRVLIDHGFHLTKVTPVDQFRWSPHVEIVGALER